MNKNNIAFIDGQNLYLGTKQDGWFIDFAKFKIYLSDKLNISEIYYFMGYFEEKYNDLYIQLQRSGFITIFKEHNQYSITKKKGNVDSDIIFDIMKNLIDNNNFNKIVLVSGDGDYKKVVDYLISKDKFEKILFPNTKFASSLYKKLGNQYCIHLSREDIKTKIIK